MKPKNGKRGTQEMEENQPFSVSIHATLMRIAQCTHLLQTAREEAGHALEGAADRDHFLSEVVQDADGEGSQRAAALPRQTVVLLHCVKHVLAHRVLYFILVIALEADQSYKHKFTLVCGA